MCILLSQILKERHALREIFYREFSNYQSSIKLVFVIGTKKNGTVLTQMMLQSELSAHNDILQIDIEDTYTNLGFKALGIFKFLEIDKTIQMLVKVDDDSPEILSTLKKYIVKLSNEDRIILSNAVICGHSIHNALAFESKLKKNWETTMQQYYTTFFPSFCEGSGGIYISRQTAFKLYEAAKDRRVFHLDDVYVTGLLRQRACLNLIDSSSPFQIFVNILYRMGTGICSVFYFDQFS